MALTDDELRNVFARAEEIDRAARRERDRDADIAAIVSAGEEVGISRSAIERAIRELPHFPAAPPAVGELAWAQSVNGRFYVAQILAHADDSSRVRFLHGGEQTVTFDQLRACAFVPGERLVCDWPWWGRWTCTVVQYDPIKRRVKLDDGWGARRNFSIGEVWLPPGVANPTSSRARVSARLLGIGVAVGTVIGALATAFLF
jgi:hypothetical protein